MTQLSLETKCKKCEKQWHHTRFMHHMQQRRYRCLGCEFTSIDEQDALNHQVHCDNAMEKIK